MKTLLSVQNCRISNVSVICSPRKLDKKKIKIHSRLQLSFSHSYKNVKKPNIFPTQIFFCWKVYPFYSNYGYLRSDYNYIGELKHKFCSRAI